VFDEGVFDGGVLGRETEGPVEADQIATVPWNHTGSDATVEFTTDEITAFCPVTNQPDFYTLKLTYRPKDKLLESKSVKLYLWGFRDKGAFAEDLAATLLDDLAKACDPEWMEVDLTQKVRGGIQIRAVMRHPGDKDRGPEKSRQ
jgi:7-cyano-7-deazaguanine reductase